ncbi:hypothetical protein [Puia dinghuensis]|uniref:Uncharacterized protein n=1 Tax=Puia dinghuensis TaxID=1792502 RepID=A0A8J2UFS1_9BACT|nr:hypothetical protein [Puia dinghuensis]GGB11232.1 hypothetical protein GCM10011511_38530 [Puia dinghuensis]
MELETLKAIWKEQDVTPDAAASRDELLALLQKRSHGPIDRMRRNLRKEAVIMAITYSGCIVFYLLAFNGSMSRVAWVFVGVLAFYFGYYYRKNQLLKRMQCVSCEVRSNLAGQLKTLQKYLRFYFWSGTLAAPVSIIAAFGIALQSRLADEPPFHWWRAIGLLSALIVVTTVATYFVNRWGIDKFYGRHVRKLQELLREMDEG